MDQAPFVALFARTSHHISAIHRSYTVTSSHRFAKCGKPTLADTQQSAESTIADRKSQEAQVTGPRAGLIMPL